MRLQGSGEDLKSSKLWADDGEGLSNSTSFETIFIEGDIEPIGGIILHIKLLRRFISWLQTLNASYLIFTASIHLIAG